MIPISSLPKPVPRPVSVYAGDDFINMVPVALLGRALSMAIAYPCQHIKVCYAGETYVANVAVVNNVLNQFADHGTAHIHMLGECVCVQEDQILDMFENLRTESMYVNKGTVHALGARNG